MPPEARDFEGAVLASVAQGQRLRDNARRLNLMPVNPPFEGLIRADQTGPIEWEKDLHLHVVAPSARRLQDLQDKWDEHLKKQQDKKKAAIAGAMTAVAAAALAGVPVAVPAAVRYVAFVLLGLSMGANVTPKTIEQVAAWPLSLALLALSVITTLALGTAYLRRVHGWDLATARFSAVPGALAAVLVLVAASSANLPRVAFAQTVRLFTLVAVMPSIIRLVAETPVAAQLTARLATGSAVDNLMMLGASAGAALLLHKLKVPAGVLLGAMLASAGLHAAGLVSGRPPQEVLIGGFVVTGAVIGARFRGTTVSILRSTLRGALEAVLLALVISAGFAAMGAYWLGLPFGQLWLAYALGGVEAMGVMALALGLDAAFVGAHHVLRILGLNLLSPVWRRSAGK